MNSIIFLLIINSMFGMLFALAYFYDQENSVGSKIDGLKLLGQCLILIIIGAVGIYVVSGINEIFRGIKTFSNLPWRK